MQKHAAILFSLAKFQNQRIYKSAFNIILCNFEAKFK